MGKRKKGNQVLTKIDPSALKPKPLAISQHAAQDGTRVTTTVKPVRQALPAPVDPFVFNANPADFEEELSEDDGSEEDELARVRVLCSYYA